MKWLEDVAIRYLGSRGWWTMSREYRDSLIMENAELRERVLRLGVLPEVSMHDHQFQHLENHLVEIRDAIAGLRREVKQMATVLDALTAQVAANNDQIGSAITLIGGLRQQIIDAGTDPAKLQALTDSLGSEDSKLAAAIAENTPTEG